MLTSSLTQAQWLCLSTLSDDKHYKLHAEVHSKALVYLVLEIASDLHTADLRSAQHRRNTCALYCLQLWHRHVGLTIQQLVLLRAHRLVTN